MILWSEGTSTTKIKYKKSDVHQSFIQMMCLFLHMIVMQTSFIN